MHIRQLTLGGRQRVGYEFSARGVRELAQEDERELPSEKWEGCRIRLGSLNSIQLTQGNRFKDLFEGNPLVDMHMGEEGERTRFRCNCKRSKCLKLYCECFSKEAFCGPECECQGCSNREVNAMRLVVIREEMPLRKEKGCRCTKSACQKRYCECFQRGAKCGAHCHCLDCHNA